ncbi:TolC family protein [Wielerella bovis]|uniref:TolC family protein n=1 Tax=Wielerella bovis TaxID=2917790 RepID=UPI0020186A5C|nr:TolC family protein [Wielerella bovis]ULJ59513.1 TolC family protein [Wielerella bovis]
MKSLKKTVSILSTLSLILLSGCQSMHSVNTQSIEQSLNLPTTFLNQQPASQQQNACQANSQDFCYQNWWHSFNDPILNAYLEQVMQHNSELSIATLNLQKSVLNWQKEKRTRFPSFNAQMRTQTGGTHHLESHQTQHQSSSEGSLNASWELDLWGKLALQQNISEWEKNASTADRQAVYLNLTANAVRAYYNLVHLNQKLQDQANSLKYQQRQLQFAQTQLKAGVIAPSELIPLQQNITLQQQNQLQLNADKNEALNQLSLLLNHHVSELPSSLTDSKHLPKIKDIFIGQPAEVLNNRPDIQAALWRLQASLTAPELTQKNLYPTLVLTAGAQNQSPKLFDLLSVPVLNWGISINLPPLNPQEHRDNLKIAEINSQIAMQQYREQVYKALADAENKLTAWQTAQDKRQLLLQTQKHVEQQFKHQNTRYQAGQIAMKELQESQEQLRQAKIAVQDNLFEQINNWIALYLAMGGQR